MYVENRTKIANFPTPRRVFNAPAEGEFCIGARVSRMMCLSDGRKSFQIGLAVLIQYRSVTDTQPARHVAVAITLHAKASSLKSARRDANTARWRGGAKNFQPAADPFPGAQDRQNLISWRWSLPSPTDPVWWRSMHAISSYRGNRPMHKGTNKQTGPITIHCAAS